jgi:hypothetical protein
VHTAQWFLFGIWKLENEEMEAFCEHHCAMANSDKTVFAQFKKTQSIHGRGYYKERMKDENPKSSVRNLQLIPHFFYRVFANPCTMYANGNLVPNCQLVYEMAL